MMLHCYCPLSAKYSCIGYTPGNELVSEQSYNNTEPTLQYTDAQLEVYFLQHNCFINIPHTGDHQNIDECG